jgi:hypothetical protein
MKKLIGLIVCLFTFGAIAFPQERIDSAAVARIKEEGFKNSQVMEILSYLTDVCGPRLTWSPEYKHAADWASGKFKEWGLANVSYDYWEPLGKGWTLKQFSLDLTAPLTVPLIAYPKAWSPSVKETEADVVYLDVKKVEDFDTFKGKLKGKFVLINEQRKIAAHFKPEANRLVDTVLLAMANADLPGGGRRGGNRFPRNISMANFDSVLAMFKQFDPNADSASVARFIYQRQIQPRILKFVTDEGALAALSIGAGDGGTIFVQQASVPQDPNAGVQIFGGVGAYDPKAPVIIPQVSLAAEHYNRLVRMIQKNQKVRLNMNLNVAMTKADSGFNIIAEIPGTDLKDEIVMIGAHFDSWHAGTGATDNGTGSSVTMETMRILQKLASDGMRPRRTIRIGLWGGEEQGLHGSAQYVGQYLGKSSADRLSQMMGGGSGDIQKTPAHDKFSVYFNNDNGGGKVRGVFLQGNEAARPVLRAWLSSLADPAAQTLTLQNTGGTDHLSFDAVGLPGFQFLVDPIEYDTRTHHSNMDVYDRIQEEDLKQAAVFMAAFAYQAAVRNEMFPRKPAPAPRQRATGSN